MKHLFLFNFILGSVFAFGQTNSDSIRTPTMRGSFVYYIDGVIQYPKGTQLDSIFSVDSISLVIIKIDNKSYQLDKKQGRQFISVISKATRTNGLQVKPTSKDIQFVFKRKQDINRNTTYFSPGSIHFDYGVDRWGNKFDGTFILPDNFDIETFVKTNK